MLGSDPDEGPSSTIGPKLESYLKAGNIQGTSLRTQMPYYVLTKMKDDGEDDKAGTGNDYQTKSAGSDEKDKEVGLLPMLLRTAKDDLKLVGNVIKYALA
jgi:hypothetical protein